ncbi:hypothetical protein [Mesorhizobium sp. 113-3-9]|uniref:hypothetical protein n=1 Tax=Mesorhizobium sp. 113-3-9 TaxID=2744517 RepID=UPI0019259BF6|nr:hypothetical protein [Mesorhizobium sp. 113-3-9]
MLLLNVRITSAFAAQSRFAFFDAECEPFFGSREAPWGFLIGWRPVSVIAMLKHSRYGCAVEPHPRGSQSSPEIGGFHLPNFVA